MIRPGSCLVLTHWADWQATPLGAAGVQELMEAAVEAEAAAAEGQEEAAGAEEALEEVLQEEDLQAGPPQQPVIHADRPA